MSNDYSPPLNVPVRKPKQEQQLQSGEQMNRLAQLDQEFGAKNDIEREKISNIMKSLNKYKRFFKYSPTLGKAIKNIETKIGKADAITEADQKSIEQKKYPMLKKAKESSEGLMSILNEGVKNNLIFILGELFDDNTK